MSNQISLIKFIDRENYNNLLDRNFNIDNLINKLNDIFLEDTKLSILTKAYILYLNSELGYILFDSNLKKLYKDEITSKLSTNEYTFVENKFNEELKSECFLEKYYELVMLPNNDILVVVENGFLNHITESKNNFLKFILCCLCYQYKFNFVFKILLNIYIKLKMNDNYFNLLKLKVS